MSDDVDDHDPARHEVLAAGGVVIRDGARHRKVLLVHRPHRDDWSFPKGKLDEGETFEQCALREVHEETGYRCDLLEELPSASYLDGRRRTKLVRYWHMAVVSGAFRPNDEVDEIEWVRLDRAGRHLTYPHDAAVLDGLPLRVP